MISPLMVRGGGVISSYTPWSQSVLSGTSSSPTVLSYIGSFSTKQDTLEPPRITSAIQIVSKGLSLEDTRSSMLKVLLAWPAPPGVIVSGTESMVCKYKNKYNFLVTCQ